MYNIIYFMHHCRPSQRNSCSVGEQIPELLKLESPDGNRHNVDVANELKTSASVYGLEEGDLLIFKYSGDPHFKVEINQSNSYPKKPSKYICITSSSSYH
jgi:hypothetical protein